MILKMPSPGKTMRRVNPCNPTYHHILLQNACFHPAPGLTPPMKSGSTPGEWIIIDSGERNYKSLWIFKHPTLLLFYWDESHKNLIPVSIEFLLEHIGAGENGKHGDARSCSPACAWRQMFMTLEMITLASSRKGQCKARKDKPMIAGGSNRQILVMAVWIINCSFAKLLHKRLHLTATVALDRWIMHWRVTNSPSVGEFHRIDVMLLVKRKCISHENCLYVSVYGCLSAGRTQAHNDPDHWLEKLGANLPSAKTLSILENLIPSHQFHRLLRIKFQLHHAVLDYHPFLKFSALMSARLEITSEMECPPYCTLETL